MPAATINITTASPPTTTGTRPRRRAESQAGATADRGCCPCPPGLGNSLRTAACSAEREPELRRTERRDRHRVPRRLQPAVAALGQFPGGRESRGGLFGHTYGDDLVECLAIPRRMMLGRGGGEYMCAFVSS